MVVFQHKQYLRRVPIAIHGTVEHDYHHQNIVHATPLSDTFQMRACMAREAP